MLARDTGSIYSAVFGWLIFGLIVFLFLSNCGGGGLEEVEDVDTTSREYRVQVIDNYRILQVYTVAYQELTPQEREELFYLYRAVLSGWRIFYDQNHRFAPQILTLISILLSHPDFITDERYQEIRDYAWRFWLNACQYDQRSGEKFVLNASMEELLPYLKEIQLSGEGYLYRDGKKIKEWLYQLSPHLFNPYFESRLYLPVKEKGQDPIHESAFNYYHGLRSQDLRGFQDRYPLNSRVRKIKGQIVEEVYRAENSGGDYIRMGKDVNNIVNELEQVVQVCSSPGHQNTLKRLVSFLSSGENKEWYQYLSLLQQDTSRVNILLGFFPTNRDPRGKKGDFSALVYYEPPLVRRFQKKVQTISPKLNDLFVRKWGKFSLKLKKSPYRFVELLLGVGAFNYAPQDTFQISDETNTREITYFFLNLASSHIGMLKEQLQKSCELQKELKEKYCDFFLEKAWQKYLVFKDILNIEGIPTGDSRQIDGRENAVINAIFNELLPLWLYGDKSLIKHGLVKDRDELLLVYLANLDGWIEAALDSRVKTEEYSEISRVIVNWLLEEADVLKIEEIGDGASIAITDPGDFREGLEALLVELMKEMEKKEDSRIGGILDEFVNLESDVFQIYKDRISFLTGKTDFYLYPQPVPELDAEGKVRDFDLVYPCDFSAQMLTFSEYPFSFPEISREKEIK